MSHDNRWTAIDGEGIAWGAGAFAATVLAGIILEPYRRTIGLENVTIIYLLIVVIAAAYGGRAAGLLAALSAALSYDFFLTTPYHQLVIDSLAQIVTVALLFGSGIVASLAGRARRRSTSQARQQTDALRLLNAITQTVAAGATGDADRTAAEGLYHLLDADRVTITRTGPTGEAVVAEVGRTDEPLDTHDLPHLDPTRTATPRVRPLARRPAATAIPRRRGRPHPRPRPSRRAWCGHGRRPAPAPNSPVHARDRRTRARRSNARSLRECKRATAGGAMTGNRQPPSSSARSRFNTRAADGAKGPQHWAFPA